MLRALSSGSVVLLLLAGCAHVPQASQPQVNRVVKADKYAAPKKPVVEAVTPNQIVKKRWYDRFKVHPKWFH